MTESKDSGGRVEFARAVEESARVDQPASPAASSEAERREQLVAYRARVEKARAEQVERVAKLAEAQRRIDAELLELEQLAAAPAPAAPPAAGPDREAEAIEVERQRLDADRAAREAHRRKIEHESRQISEERDRIDVEERAALERRREQVETITSHYVAATTAPAPAPAPVAAPPAPKPAVAKPAAVAAPRPAATTAPAPPPVPSSVVKRPIVAPRGNVRRGPRFDIHAAVRFSLASGEIVMRAKNISMTGALLLTEPATVASFTVGTVHQAQIFVTSDPKDVLTLPVQIVRQEPGAIVIDWSSDVEATFRVALIIATLPAT